MAVSEAVVAGDTEKVANVTTNPPKEESDIGDMVKYENGQDEALKYIQAVSGSYTEEDERRVRRKIDMYMLPW